MSAFFHRPKTINATCLVTLIDLECAQVPTSDLVWKYCCIHLNLTRNKIIRRHALGEEGKEYFSSPFFRSSPYGSPALQADKSCSKFAALHVNSNLIFTVILFISCQFIAAIFYFLSNLNEYSDIFIPSLRQAPCGVGCAEGEIVQSTEERFFNRFENAWNFIKQRIWTSKLFY